MKRFSFFLSLSLIGLAVFSSCTLTEEAEELAIVETDLCTQKATVMESDCGGLYLRTSRGISIYANADLDLALEVGDKVALGFYQFPLQSAMNSDHTPDGNGGCYNGEEDKTNAGLDPREACLQEKGIAPAAILCIELDNESSPKSD
jgi:hypothetical protein